MEKKGKKQTNKQTNNKVKISLIAKISSLKNQIATKKNKPITNEIIKSTTKLKTTYIKL